MRRPRIRADERGAAATEFALLLPMLLVLLFGGIEAGHFVWTQHKLVEAVRNGARYASRLPIAVVCPEGEEMSDEVKNEIILITRTGQVKDASTDDTCTGTGPRPKVCGWTADEVTVDPGCNAPEFVSTGIYADLGLDDEGNRINGPVVTVRAQNVQYPWMFGMLGSVMSGIAGEGDNALDIRMSASSNAAGIGL